tara:strand:- start:6131 stop:6589 length:459 start_codon:yes stop_codon:yes gene_type:complete
MDNASARAMWGDYLDAHLEHAFVDAPKVVHMGPDELQANKSAELVRQGVKKAISYSLLGLQYRKESLPKIGDFMVVTDWEGKAQCIVKTTAMQLKPFFSIDENFAKAEGDQSLDQWKQTHWEYYTEELQSFGRVPRDSMIVVCQTFEKVFER